jgi:5-methylcytosine-specific restriction endonuclease McrA
MATRSRPSIPIPLQLAVYLRDRWLCHLCKKPLIFPLTLRLLADQVRQEIPPLKVAYYSHHWGRESAPLLDELGACIDHVQAFAKGGQHAMANFAAVCARCNGRKSARTRSEYLEVAKPWKVKGKHGEPRSWDGLTSVYVLLARQSARELIPTERTWLRLLEEELKRSTTLMDSA